jgi:hypothetical protein
MEALTDINVYDKINRKIHNMLDVNWMISHRQLSRGSTLTISGNDNLNLLTSAKRYKLRVDLEDFNGTTRYAEYDNFVVKSSSDKYRLSSLENYIGTAG